MTSKNEIITLQFGHFSNHIGAHWWNIQVELVMLNALNFYCLIFERFVRYNVKYIEIVKVQYLIRVIDYTEL